MSLKHVLQGRGLAHPLHGALVHLPIGLFFGSFLFDIVSLFQSDPVIGNFFVQASWYCILAGVIVAAPTAITGLAEFVDIPSAGRVQRYALLHMILNVLVVVGYVAQLFIRDRGIDAVRTSTFVFNLIEILVLSYSGYIGGKMVYQFAVGSRTPLNPQRDVAESKTETERNRRVA